MDSPELFYQMETSEWGPVNKELRQHGLPCIELEDPKHVSDSNGSDRVVLCAAMAKRLRDTLHTLMRDCDRRQELLQELIATNAQLRQELRTQMELSQSHPPPDNAKVCSKQGEERDVRSELTEQMKQLQQENHRLQQHIDALNDRLIQQQDESTSPENGTSPDPTESTSSSSQKSQQDERIVAIIDSYERRLANLKEELDRYRPSGSPIQQSLADNQELHKCKAIIKTYERQVREAKNKVKVSENELELLRLELQSRPDVRDLRECQAKTKKLEAILKKQRYYRDDVTAENGKKYSTHVDDIETLPAAQCRRMLKHICVEARVEDVDYVLPRLQKLTQLNDAHPKLEQFAHDVLRLVDEPDLPRPTELHPHHPHHRAPHRTPSHAVWCEKTWHHVLPTLHYWALQLRSLKDLQTSLNNLQSSLLPWRKKALSGPATASALIEAVDDMLTEDNNNSHMSIDPDSDHPPPRSVLQGIVQHFMNLFDVGRLTGCYARMNDIYTKLGEVHNVMKALKNLLALDSGVRSSEVVESVARVCEVANTNATLRQLREVLDGQDMHMVLEKLQQHEEFFPVFQSIINKLMDILNVNRIDQIIPAVRAQKLLVSS